MDDTVEFTILMPCLNEERAVGYCIQEAMQYIADRRLDAEVLVADNGSRDHSAEIAAAKGARVVCVDAAGYGNALIGGIRNARGRYIIIGDCDGSYDFGSLDGFVELLRGGCGLVVGNRFLGGIERGAMPFHHRYIGVPFLSFVGRLRYHTGVGDFHCGLRGCSREAALSLGLKCPGMEFATEMIGRFAQSGYCIRELPVVLRRDKREGRSHLRSVRDGWRHLRFMLWDA